MVTVILNDQLIIVSLFGLLTNVVQTRVQFLSLILVHGSVVLHVSSTFQFMAYNLRNKPRVDYAKLNEGLTSGSEEEIFMLFTKSSDASKVSEQGACGSAEDEEDSELVYLKELLAAEEKTKSDLKQHRKEAERAKEQGRSRAQLDKHRAENKVLAQGAKQSESSNAVTSHDLLSFDSLALDVEKQLGKMGLSEHKLTDSDADSDTSSPQEEKDSRYHSRSRRGKQLKSGKTTKEWSGAASPLATK